MHIGEGEAEILKTLSFSQGNFHIFKERVLKTWIVKKNVLDASSSIDEIAKSFSRAGLFFPIRDEYLKSVNANPEDFQNVVFNKFTKLY